MIVIKNNKILNITLIIVLLFVILSKFIFEIDSVFGNSMLPTLQHGEEYLINKLNKGTIGDIIVVDIKNEKLVKRIIAGAGDEFFIEDGVLYVNNEESPYQFPGTADFVKTVIPDNQVFVLGDNRNNSIDSRAFGPINKDKIAGKLIENNKLAMIYKIIAISIIIIIPLIYLIIFIKKPKNN